MLTGSQQNQKARGTASRLRGCLYRSRCRLCVSHLEKDYAQLSKKVAESGLCCFHFEQLKAQFHQHEFKRGKERLKLEEKEAKG